MGKGDLRGRERAGKREEKLIALADLASCRASGRARGVGGDEAQLHTCLRCGACR